MRRDFPLLEDNELWLGANFWSRRGGPLMWRHLDVDLWRSELTVLRDHGLTMTRSFFYWPDFHPEPYRIDEDCVDRYRAFLDLNTELGMRTVPTFIVGHMSGENWDPAWRGGRDLFSDVWFVARQAWFVTEMVSRFKDHPAVTAWLLSNEMPIYAEPSTREHVVPWVQLLVNAVRAAGGTQPVGTGDGGWGPENSGVDNGFPLREIAPLVDFIGPHVYRMETDVVRQHHHAAFACDLAHFDGRPVILEEFGVTTDFASDANAGHYYRQALHNSLLAGASGWVAWNNTDYDDLWDQAPYSHHPFEMHFGITDSQGRPKAPLRELQAFGRTLDRLEVKRCTRPEAEVAIVVPSYLEHAYPFTQAGDRAAIFPALLQSYIAAREADLSIGIAREWDGLPDDVKLLILPSLKALTAPTWRRLEQLAAAGATVYVSYCAGIHDVQRGPWFGDVNRFFGVEHQLVYGITDPIVDDEIEVRFTRDVGQVVAGTVLRFPAAGNADSRSYLPVVATEADVLAVDAHGNPVLTSRSVGNGRLVLCTYPFEHMASQRRAANPEPSWLLYDALADLAGVTRGVQTGDPRVNAGQLDHEDGRRFVFLVSQYDREITVKPQAPGDAVLRDFDTGDQVADVTIPPYGVIVLLLEAPST